MSTLRITDDLARDLAAAEGACVRPLLRRLTDQSTGNASIVVLPCGSTRTAQCPSCADKARRLRMQQCAEGWHRTDEPPTPDTDDDERDQLEADQDDEDGSERRVRSTRRRQDAPNLPRLPVEDRTVGHTFTSPDGKTYRPSMFVTLTLPSYGRITPGHGTPPNPSAYDYRRAALDALHFSKLVDRWVQNLRRAVGYNVQYFAAVEAQRRLAPHLHTALRGAIPRALLKQVTAATYHQIWWPSLDHPIYTDPDTLPVWDADTSNYLDPTTGEVLTTWADALDQLDHDHTAKPMHVLRFGQQTDIQGIIAPSPDADRTIRYLTKYLAKSVADTYDTTDEPTPARAQHLRRLHHEVRYIPCSPRCANWLRHGIQPDQPRPGLQPGHCPSKAHDRHHLGLGGRRVLVSRKWTGKTLTDHKADRAAIVRAVLAEAGIDMHDTQRTTADQTTADGRPRWRWEPLTHNHTTYQTALAHAINEARQWRQQYQAAKQRANAPPSTKP
ncbi:MAG: hypothetical protein JWN95_3771 [Frankiales bacterium]|nr:hypothetical protein [Frankiales bacterium]